MSGAERVRLQEMREHRLPWRLWGPYVSERSWGTVREDYSPDGRCWEFLPHDHARSKAYRWGEDGLAGICDRYQVLVFALALWNGKDPILKERLFGLSNGQGNHGEDVKECYYYLDNVPSHAYMRYLYKYPQAAFPYEQLLEENRRRTAADLEYELADTGVFDSDRYFDVFVEYAKLDPEDILIRIEAFNRGPDPAALHVLPHLWFRNTWSWTHPPKTSPVIREGARTPPRVDIVADDAAAPRLANLGFDYRLGTFHLYAEEDGEPLFTDNETNAPAVFGAGSSSCSRHVKDAFHRYLVAGDRDAVNPARTGTKACLVHRRDVPPGGSTVVRLRLTHQQMDDPLAGLDAFVAGRRREADEFYEEIHPPLASPDEKLIQRQALSGLLWSKQLYLYDVARWLDGDDPLNPPPAARLSGRNAHWRHLRSMRVLSMPDKWEYPWFAAWDLAFQAIPLCLVDPQMAKDQLWLLLFEQFQHISGQIPAHEFEFSDLNPPVQAWAVWRVYRMDREQVGKPDTVWLERCYHKLLINFACWVNKVDRKGNNIFEGGFLGLDNITVIDRSEKMPGGAVLEQSDATGWMGMFCLNLMRIALELARHNKAYEALATKFFEHYAYVGSALKTMGGRDHGLWSERDGFFYDVLRHADGTSRRFRVRSLVGLIPLYAVEGLEEKEIDAYGGFSSDFRWFLENRSDVARECWTRIRRDDVRKDIHVLAVVNAEQLERILQRVWDPQEFRSRFGLRSLSRYHRDNPFRFGDSEVRYEPAESRAVVKGGNSNWRGPVWFPTTFLMIESLRRLGAAYGPRFTVQVPGSDEPPVSLDEMARELADSLIRVFTRDADGRRPVFGGARKFQEDPQFRDYLLFYEYFHGDEGAGIGASHQTGWTALVATLIDEWRR
jgi:hypothetical protein